MQTATGRVHKVVFTSSNYDDSAASTHLTLKPSDLAAKAAPSGLSLCICTLPLFHFSLVRMPQSHDAAAMEDLGPSARLGTTASTGSSTQAFARVADQQELGGVMD